MRLYLTALNPTDAVLDGLLPAAERLDLPVTVLTDQPTAWPDTVAEVVGCDVRDVGSVAATVRAADRPVALLSNSDHLQTPTALAAEYLDLPGKDWRTTLRCKDKRLTRRTLAEVGLDRVEYHHLGPADDPAPVAASMSFPAVVKPCAGVASEDVFLVGDAGELVARIADIRRRRPTDALVVEEYLTGELRTFDTLGDRTTLVQVGGWHTELGPPPTFVEESLDWSPTPDGPARDHLRAQLDALGVNLGACHVEYVVQGDRARLIEVNYRLIGDRMDLILAELLDVPLFEYVIRLHAGEPVTALPLPDPTALVRHARVEYVCADRAGTLVVAPGTVDRRSGGLRVSCRPLRRVGVTSPLTGTNRDYLAVLHAIGPDPAAVRAALVDFRARHRWEVAA